MLAAGVVGGLASGVNARVAQLDRATPSEGVGRRFDSCLAHFSGLPSVRRGVHKAPRMRVGLHDQRQARRVRGAPGTFTPPASCTSPS